MLHKLSKVPGSTKNRKRIGRGPGSTLGKTCGRGHNGQKSRSGSGKRVGFEGGQMPIHRRLPKRGFTNIFRTEYRILNLDRLSRSEKINLTKLIDAKALVESGLIDGRNLPVKLLGNGNITLPINIQVDRVSASAQEKIVAAGGSVILPS